VLIEASNAQRKQSYRADTENQHDQRDRIIVEPMCARIHDLLIQGEINKAR